MEELAPIERRAFIQGLIASAVAAGVPLPIVETAPTQVEMLFKVIHHENGGIAGWERIA